MNRNVQYKKTTLCNENVSGRVFRTSTVSAIALLASAFAVSADEYKFDIAPQRTDYALLQLAEIANVQIVFSPQAASKTKSPAIRGTRSLEAALEAALGATDLTYEFKSDDFVVVKGKREKISWSGGEGSVSTGVQFAQLQTTSPQFAARQSSTPISPQADTEELAIDEITVTGSRLARSELTSTSPVTVLDGEEFRVRGVTRVEDLINTLPQALAGQSAFSGINAGTATVNLRGLGADRTLVLVDGKRLPFGSPISVAADLNQVPAQLVERVEVLTGGASAVYGADAIAGVVNFKMKRDFEGVEANVQGSFFQAGNNNSSVEQVLADFNQPNPGSSTDGATIDFSVIAGGNLDNGKGNITAYFGYSNDGKVRWEDRDISSCPFGTRNDGTEFSCRGSGSMPQVTRFTRSGAGNFNLTVDPATQGLRNFDSSTDTFNFALGNYFQRPRERFTMGAFMHYELHPNVEWYLNYSFVDNSTEAQIAPSGLSLGRTTSINCDNPLLNSEQFAVFCDPTATFVDDTGVTRAPLFIGRRNIEGGPRSNEFKLTTHRAVMGFRGEAFEGFDYEVFGQYANVDFSETLKNDVLTERARLALDVVTDPVTGQPVCRSALSGAEPDCVPWNIFRADGVTQEATAFLTEPSLRNGATEQLVIGASLAGSLDEYGIISPYADDAVQVVVGFEFRRDYLELTPDSSDGLTVQREPVSGAVEVYEFFSELQVPLVQNRSFFQELSLHGAFRYSDYYDTTGTQSTYSGGVTWQPVSDVRIRGQYQRATRSPNPIELFSPQADGGFILSAGVNGLRDPCSGDFDPDTSTPEPAATFEQCARTGVTEAQYGQILDNSTGEFDTLSGGNPNLDPEVSNTWTAGIVITPEMMPGLTLSVDYFSIDVNGFIGTVPPELALNNCLNSNDEFFCSLINRDSAGTLWLVDGESFIQATNINTGELRTSGVDLNVNYAFDLDNVGIANGGEMRLNYIATVLSSFEEQSLPGEDFFDCAGFYGGVCATPRPKYRHRVSVDWSSPEEVFNATLSWRFVDSVSQFGTNTSPIIEELEATSFFDLALRYALTDSLELRAGVNNIFDQDPPLTSIAGFGGSETSGRGNTFPQIYDAQGRFVFAGIRASF